MKTGFVYALLEREFTKTKEPVIKIGMSRKANPADRLRGYPKGSFYIWVRHTPSASKDERLILATMKIWFKQRTDLGAEYFEGDQNVVTGLLSALMQARESMMSEESDDDVVSSDTPEDQGIEKPEPQQKPAPVDNIALFDAFAREKFPTLNRASIPCAKMHAMFSDFWNINTEAVMRVGNTWIERQCKSRLGATLRPPQTGGRNRNRNRKEKKSVQVEEQHHDGDGHRILDRNDNNKNSLDSHDKKKQHRQDRSHSSSKSNYVNFASVQWVRFENVKEDATVFNFIEKGGGKFVTWDLDEHVNDMVGRITSSPLEEFFPSGPFKVFFPIRIKNGELRGDFFIQHAFEYPPTYLAIFNAVRTTIITAISFVIVSEGEDDGVVGNKKNAEQYLSQVIVQNLLVRITGGARHVYVHWEKKRLNDDALTRRSMKRLSMSPIPIK
eukprot:gene29992-18065_t